jgi:hypothetical protein
MRAVVAFVVVFAVILVILATASGCGAARTSDPGVGADLQVAGGSFVRGALPAPSAGPAVMALELSDARVFAGESDRPLLGALAPSATSVLLALDGDRGYWVVGAGVPSTEAPDEPTFDVRLGFARDLPTATRQLVAEAVDAGGHVGAPSMTELQVAGTAIPSGALVVHLGWGGDADLDLHVVLPDGSEAWARNPAGILDGDSNAECVIDGRNQENAVWVAAPPSGHYVVRVDAASLCGLPYADWRVDEVAGGTVVATATGEALDADTRGAHERGSGRTALEFDVP